LASSEEGIANSRLDGRGEETRRGLDLLINIQLKIKLDLERGTIMMKN